MKEEVSSAITYALNKGFQIHPDAFKILEKIDVKELQNIIKQIVREKAKQNLFLINRNDLKMFVESEVDETVEDSHVILFDPTKKVTSAEGIVGFTTLFLDRYSKLLKIMMARSQSKRLTSIADVASGKFRDETFIAGLLMDRKIDRDVTKLVIDDPTGSIEILVFNKELQESANSLLMDQFLMAAIASGKNGGFIARELLVPDVPEHIASRSKTETYAVLISDLHVGSKYFMEKEFAEFVLWLSSPDPVARKVRFLLVCGDIVDGIGIFPNQDKELLLMDVDEQMAKAAQLLDKIPKHIKVFIIPGNHDPGRRALPQPAIPEKHNMGLWNRENFFMLGNPSVIVVNGVKILMFHGQSLDDVVGTTPGLSYAQPARAMRALLRTRHLSPIYGKRTPIAPELEDFMVINDVPDIYHSGHIHVVDLEMYKGTLIVNSGAWQTQTPYQASVGINPTPGIAVIVNLATMKVFTKNFVEDSD
ncbi:MAG: DNA-directed DNA polymerase II small subunit [Thaumarchaeota archaeon]|nr:MAG: DNA polymerase II [Thaumarchaeota archaeon 13_1_40CM_4_38_7]OLC92144.1 MAG: DNA polymerase II [Thaumarchaeota archaeon 13_1_40CM_3_38_6]OLD41426.1 MAG: DNA polymerase II [Thaumarchaeota archaeon 13_1_40CM_2_39_4]TLY03030.1 MAG: DNA-directed DNA polymerase II small subunit [Nitrososphaerota archaeon]TLY08652.1 MAG: DNA-directed DNA polymerase II small subunit [Nitrososphaerota archaeon]